MTSKILPLDRIAVRVENEEESRAVQERYFALGKKWHGDAERGKVTIFGKDCPLFIHTTTVDEGRNALGWSMDRHADYLTIEHHRVILPASSFLRDYPAPGEPERFGEFKVGDKVGSAGNSKWRGTVISVAEYEKAGFWLGSGRLPVRDGNSIGFIWLKDAIRLNVTPAEPKYAYLKNWKPGERVMHNGYGTGIVMSADERGDFTNVLELSACLRGGSVPVCFDSVWSMVRRRCLCCDSGNLTRLTDSGNGTEATSPQKALESWGQKTPEAKPEAVFRVIEKPPFVCHKCKKTTPGAHAHDVSWDGEAEGKVTLCTVCYEALIQVMAKFLNVPFGARKQTRAEALEYLAKGSRWTHPRLPWFGDAGRPR